VEGLTTRTRYSKYETTNLQYAEFINSVAVFDDRYKLYSELMSEHFWGGINRVNNDKGYSYTVKDGYEKFPVTFVSWFDAVRFVNWLHFGKPNTGTGGLYITEGNSSIGAYNTEDFPDILKSVNSAKLRNNNARFWLPN
jgi:sulfatase modifying factor 1